MRGKVVAITGAGQGIGLALAEKLHERGARLALLDIDARAVTEAADRLGRRSVRPLVADVADRAGMAAAIDTVTDHFGGLDVIVANAGVTPPPATLRTVDLAAFDRVVSINQTGVLNTVRPALEQIIARRGHALVVSSCAAFSPGLAGAAYMTSKAASEQIGRALRLELAAHGATAGVAYFGFVDTQLARTTLDDDPLGKQVGEMLSWPLNRRITPEQAGLALANAIARRSPRMVAPKAWAPYSVLRGVVNPVIDAYLVRNAGVRDLVHEVERATSNQRPAIDEQV